MDDCLSNLRKVLPISLQHYEKFIYQNKNLSASSVNLKNCKHLYIGNIEEAQTKLND